MRYILRNIRLFMTNQRGIYLLSIAAVMSSVFLLHFSYSLYQSFMKEKDADSDYQIIPRKGTKYVTIKDLKRLLKKLSEEFQKEVLDVGTEVVVDNVPYICWFGVENGEIVMSKFYRDNITMHSLPEGRFLQRRNTKRDCRLLWMRQLCLRVRKHHISTASGQRMVNT